MPLLVITGFPASGKSTICTKIKEEFEKRNTPVIIINDHLNGTVANNTYANFKTEKESRGLLRSNVQRALDKTTLVICDSLNYIKGFRYELYCVAKQVSTTYAILHCKADSTTCEWLNNQREESKRYSKKVLEDLIKRFEKPDSMNRWDSPLFDVLIGKNQTQENESLLQTNPEFDDFLTNVNSLKPCGLSENLNNMHEQNNEENLHLLFENVKIPIDELFTVLVKGKNLRPNTATQSLAPKASLNYLHEVDQITQKIIKKLIEKQRDAIPGDKLKITVSAEVENEKNHIVFNRLRTLAELTRLKKQFLNYTKMHTVNDLNLISSLFIDFINSNS